jgi:hypothetical protein
MPVIAGEPLRFGAIITIKCGEAQDKVAFRTRFNMGEQPMGIVTQACNAGQEVLYVQAGTSHSHKEQTHAGRNKGTLEGL